jgi:putative ubiquitin-RnfH superfamily antitoxin RatB of RatAB toxin-antitoxin module
MDNEPVQVVYATPDRQSVETVPWQAGMTALDAVEASRLLDGVARDEREQLVLGILGARVESDRVLGPGDRVEICRPLLVDPRDLRRELAASGQVMGGSVAEPRKPFKDRDA